MTGYEKIPRESSREIFLHSPDTHGESLTSNKAPLMPPLQALTFYQHQESHRTVEREIAHFVAKEKRRHKRPKVHMYENVSWQTSQVDAYLLWSSTMLVSKWHLSGCSAGLRPLCYFSAPCTDCLVDQTDKLHQAADVQSKESPWFCRNLRLNAGGLGSKQSWN